MDKYFLRAKKLTKDYGQRKGAIDISFDVYPGEIVGFIGPNGAGKTTTMRMLMRFIAPQKGSLEIFGMRIVSETDMLKVLSQIGYLPGEPSLYTDLSPKELFTLTGKLYGADFRERYLSLANYLELDLNRKIKDLSTGNKQKAAIIAAILHSPRLVILDEPTNGLDPLIQQKVLSLLQEIRKGGGSVFLSSHVLSEVEKSADRIIMIKDAKIVLEGKTSTILSRAVKRFRIENPSEGLIKALKKFKPVSITNGEDHVIVDTNDVKPVLELLIKHNEYNFYLERPKLEDMFLENYD